MGAVSMLLLLFGCIVAVSIMRFFLTWKPRNKLGGNRVIRPVVRRR